MLRGALASLTGEHLPADDQSVRDIALPTWDALEAEGYGYETVFVILPRDGSHLDVAQIRTRLDQLGESVLVAGDGRAVKMHIHNERPDEVFAYGLSLGTLSMISVENLDSQATRCSRSGPRRSRPIDVGAVAWRPAKARPWSAFVAGRWLGELFSSLGTAAVVQGGQGANPSAGELADAIRGAGTAESSCFPTTPT